MENIKKNKASFFILPMLGWQIADLGERFINAYIGDVNNPEYNDHILLLFKFNGSKPSMDYEIQLKTHPRFVKIYDPVEGATIFVYRINKDDFEDLEKFKLGKYSKLSDNLKLSICVGRPKTDKVVKACDPTAWDRKLLKDELEKTLDQKIDLPIDAEILSVPNMEKEIFNVSIFDL